jgi:anti-sigma factor RsiW
MTIAAKPLDQITAADIDALVDGRVPEARNLEFKRDAIGTDVKARREFLKDVSALANTIGGDLVIGIADVDSVADKIAPLSLAEPRAEEQRLEQMLDSGIAPRLTGTRIRAVEVTGGYAIVVRVRPGWRPPHRVTYDNASRYYARTANRVYEMDNDQLRDAFLGGAELTRRLEGFRTRRNEIIGARERQRLLAPGILAAHIVPVQAGLTVLDVPAAYLVRHEFSPLRWSSQSTTVNHDGMAVVSRAGDEVEGYTQIFRDGSVETTFAPILVARQEERFNNHLRWTGFLPELVDAVARMTKSIHRLGFAPPYALMVSLLEVRGSRLTNPKSMFDDSSANLHRDLLFDQIFIEDATFGDQWQVVLREPLFDRLWQAHGYLKCSGPFDDNGAWTGNFSR